MDRWTPERLGAARQMWLAGVAASEIARTLGHGITRNAVLGMATRRKWRVREGHAVEPQKQPEHECEAVTWLIPNRRYDGTNCELPLMAISLPRLRFLER